MNLKALVTLLNAIQKGSLAAAAQEGGYTPSAASLQIKQLEAWFGKPLFDRSARSVSPTPFALEVAETTRALVERLDALRSRSDLAVSGHVRLGAIYSVQADMLPRALSRLKAERRELTVSLSSWGDTDALLDELKADRLDAAVVVRPGSTRSSRLHWNDLFEQDFVLLVPANSSNLSLQAYLQEYDWIAYDPTLTGGKLATRYVHKMQPSARSAMDLRSIDAIVSMISQGHGISVIPRPRATLLAAYQVREVHLGDGAPVRQISLVRRKADIDSRKINAVLHAFAAESEMRESSAVPAAARNPQPDT